MTRFSARWAVTAGAGPRSTSVCRGHPVLLQTPRWEQSAADILIKLTYHQLSVLICEEVLRQYVQDKCTNLSLSATKSGLTWSRSERLSL